jgi:hypothetical protein
MRHRERRIEMRINDTFRRFAAGALALTGLLHLALAPEYLEERAYVGVLFVIGGMAAVGLGVLLWRRDEARLWPLAGVLAGGMAVGFVLSRTVGLPGFHESEWELSGVLCLVLEVGFVVVAARALAPGGDRRALTA